MQVNKLAMLDIINRVKPGLAKKEIIEQATHLIFTQNEVATFSDQVCVLHPFPCDFTFSVKGDDFQKIISGISEPEFDMTMKDGCLVIKSKTTNASLSTMVGEDARVDHLVEQIKQDCAVEGLWKPLPKDFTSGMFLCAFSASKDLATGVTACIAVKKDTLYSTDNLRASMYVMEGAVDEMIIPARYALELVKYPITQYGISENWLHFSTPDGIIFCCKMMKGEYIYEQMKAIFVDCEPNLTLPSSLKDAVAGVIILAEGEIDINKSITLMFENNQIIVKAEKERGWITKTVSCNYTGAPLKFAINPIFLNQILQHAVEVAIFPNKAMFLTDVFYHIIALPLEG